MGMDQGPVDRGGRHRRGHLYPKIIVGVVLPKLPASFAEAATVIGQILNVVIWAIVIIALIIFAFAMIGCLWSFVGAPLLRHSSLVLISHAVL
jgi:hypothetical protein